MRLIPLSLPGHPWAGPGPRVGEGLAPLSPTRLEDPAIHSGAITCLARGCPDRDHGCPVNLSFTIGLYGVPARWSMRSWESVRRGAKRRQGLPRSHGPSEGRVERKRVNRRLASRRAGFLPAVAAALAFGRIRAMRDRTAVDRVRARQITVRSVCVFLLCRRMQVWRLSRPEFARQLGWRRQSRDRRPLEQPRRRRGVHEQVVRAVRPRDDRPPSVARLFGGSPMT